MAQAVAVGALLLVPLFATGSKLTTYTHIFVPYGGQRPEPAPINPRQPGIHREGPQPNIRTIQIVAPSRVPTRIDESGATDQPIASTSPTNIGDSGGNPGPNIPGLLPGFAPDPGPRPPLGPDTSAPIPRGPVQVSQLSQLALLIHKVEPTYPPLAKLTHREGTVQLHAIISRDGRVMNLEVLSGDMLLVQSARDAVAQWRFRPTVLNGQPVEVETYITVVFRLGQ